MSKNPLLDLLAAGQSIWHDNIKRSLMTSGKLRSLMENDGLRGVTSNPAIFEKAITGSNDYDEQLRALAAETDDPVAIYEGLAVTDIRLAADTLESVYRDTNGGDGFVSLECSPLLAHDTEGTIAEARRLWKTVDRPNVMIKIPATEAGFPAIEQSIHEGINVNITLIFSLSNYELVMEAYIRGLERRLQDNKPVGNIASVASFFVSRIDTATDALLEERAAKAASETDREEIQSIKGRVAIANAKMAYQRFKDVFHGSRFESLRKHGARVQRPLWASTSTKNPSLPDVYYVEALIGPETVNTLPPETIDAFRDHGRVRLTLEENFEEERALLSRLTALEIDLDQVTDKVLEEGVEKFVQPFEKLLDEIARAAGKQPRDKTRAMKS